MSEDTREPTLEERIFWLENRVKRLEAAVFPNFSVQPGSGQKQIHSNPDRKDVGMGPLLNGNSEFL